MARQQTLQTIIALSGRVDNSFNAISTALANVGNQINQLSQRVIEFGTESVKNFIDYDDVMRQVQALGEYDDKTMRELDEYNKSIALSSKWTMQQAGEAEVLMAQLGLSMDQTRTLMPSVMDMATAANIDLADSLDYLYYTLNALGKPMDYANTLSDQMSKTAAISAADIDTLGQSMQRLGSGAQFFAGGSAEILAILGGISQFGEDMQGTSAGTQLRNFMLTLMAPTKSKQEILDSLSLTEDEWNEYQAEMDDAGLSTEDTAKAMEELGLSIYDSVTGELKPAIQIIGEMDEKLSGLSNEEKNKRLGELFGKRTTTTALNLMAALETIKEYYAEITENSEGYTQAMAETMEGGLGGSIRDLQASWDALKTTVGGTIAPTVQGIVESTTDVVNSLASMDDGKLQVLVGGLTGIAVAGPALMTAAGAIRLIGFALTPVGAAAVGVTALAAALGALAAYKDFKFESNFGEMDLNTEPLIAQVNAITDAFTSSYDEVNKYSDALQSAVTDYQTAATALSSGLTTAMITGNTLSDAEIQELQGLGTSMGNAMIDGINASFDKSAAYMTELYGGLENAASDENFGAGIMLLGKMKDSLLEQANSLGKELGAAIGIAMDGGVLTGNEYDVLMEKINAYNEAMAVVQNAEHAGDMEDALRRAQSVSLESLQEFLEEQAEITGEAIANAESQHAKEYGSLGYYYDYAIAHGWENPLTQKPYTAEDKETFLADLDARYNANLQGYKDDMAQITLAAFDSLMSGSDFGDAWNLMQRLYANPNFNPYDLDAVDWMSMLPRGVTPEEMQSQIYAMANAEHAGLFGKNSALYGIIEPYVDSDLTSWIPRMFEDAGQIATYYKAYDARSAANELWYNGSDGVHGVIDAVQTGIGKADFSAIADAVSDANEESMSYINMMVENLKSQYDFNQVRADMRPEAQSALEGVDSAIQDMIAAVELMFNHQTDYETYRLNGEAEVEGGAKAGKKAQEDAQDAFGEGVTGTATIEGAKESADAQWKDAQGVFDTPISGSVNIVGAGAAANAAVAEAQAVLSSAQLTMTITTATNTSSNRAGSLASKGGGYGGGFGGGGGRLLEKAMGMFAEGGRADEASIFGEDGPEWAIPEEHSQRVANLFDMAREASGFTWPELIARNGGLNAGGHVPTQIIYSPTIYAQNANGVEAKLKDDKARLDKWWREKQMRNEVEVYA